MTDASLDPMPLAKSYANVDGKRMAYHEVGTGDPVVFLHGNPTSSYLWRNVTPHVSDRARCIAPDLIGQGDSDKLDDTGPRSMTSTAGRSSSPSTAGRPLTWPREIPIEGEPADVVEIVQAYADWLTTSDVPKLFINADPGAILTGPQREFCRTWPNQTEVTVPGSHFIQEDSPHEIGQAIANWLPSL